MSNPELNEHKSNPNYQNDHFNPNCKTDSSQLKWRQPFNSSIVFLLNLCLIGIVQSMGNSLTFTTTNMLEKRYAYDSKISAIIGIADNISSMILGPIIGLYGIRFNRARLIGYGELIVAGSFFIYALPYFIYGPATHFLHEETDGHFNASAPQNTVGMCSLDDHHLGDNCESDKSGSTIWPAVIIFFTANFIRGIGTTIFFVIAMPFIDDNVPKGSSPIYIAVMQCVMLVGPALGYIAFGVFLSLYEDPWNDSGLSTGDPRFIGAWWLGYLMVGLLLLLVSWPMFLFPGQFSGAPVQTIDLKKKMKESGGTRQALKRFFANPLILLFFLGNATRYSGTIGYYTFAVKYMETQYRQSTAVSGVAVSLSSMFPLAIGMLLGGVIISVFKPKGYRFFIFLFLVELVSVFAFGSGLLLGCSPLKINGDLQDDGTLSLNTPCNSACHCSTRVFTPLCETQSESTYFSPCHGGCASFDSINSTFSNCSCFSGTATKGYCPTDVSSCLPNLYIFSAALAIGNVISSTSTSGNFLINYRAVDPIDKSFSSGLISTFISLLSFIPVPLLYGHLTDSACLIWETKCGKRGNCWLYDNDRFRTLFLGATVIFLALGSFFDFLMIFWADRLENLYDDENESDRKVSIEEHEHQMERLN